MDWHGKPESKKNLCFTQRQTDKMIHIIFSVVKNLVWGVLTSEKKGYINQTNI